MRAPPADPRAWLPLRARRTPSAPALALPDRDLSYADLWDEARALAGGLARAGIRPGDVVATLLGSAGFATALHAIWLLGAVVLPLNLRLTRREMAAQLEDARAAWLLHGPDALDGSARDLAALLPGLVPLSPERDARPLDARVDDPSPAVDRLLAVLFTSGTTGRPKGAMLTAASFRASALASRRHLRSRPSDRTLACMPLFHVGGLSILVRSLLLGSCVRVHESFEPAAVARALDDDAISDVSLVASMLSRVLDERAGARSPDALRTLLVGGGPVPEPLLERARRRGFPVAPTYGLTEAASQVATRAPWDDTALGLRPLPGVEVRVDAREAPEGEILVRGANVMQGYLHRPRETADVLRDGWLHTGDLGRMLGDGTLEVLDRRSDLIVSGGENVYPAEVESVLLAHPGVAEVGVGRCADPRYGARPVAWFVAARGAIPDEAELRAFCRERLAAFKVPVAFHRVDQLPRTAAGKLRRVALGSPQPSAGSSCFSSS